MLVKIKVKVYSPVSTASAALLTFIISIIIKLVCLWLQKPFVTTVTMVHARLLMKRILVYVGLTGMDSFAMVSRLAI